MADGAQYTFSNLASKPEKLDAHQPLIPCQGCKDYIFGRARNRDFEQKCLGLCLKVTQRTSSSGQMLLNISSNIYM